MQFSRKDTSPTHEGKMANISHGISDEEGEGTRESKYTELVFVLSCISGGLGSPRGRMRGAADPPKGPGVEPGYRGSLSLPRLWRPVKTSSEHQPSWRAAVPPPRLRIQALTSELGSTSYDSLQSHIHHLFLGDRNEEYSENSSRFKSRTLLLYERGRHPNGGSSEETQDRRRLRDMPCEKGEV